MNAVTISVSLGRTVRTFPAAACTNMTQVDKTSHRVKDIRLRLCISSILGINSNKWHAPTATSMLPYPDTYSSEVL